MTDLLRAAPRDRRALGEDVMLSEVESVIQAVEGVDYVDLDSFGGVPEKMTKPAEPDARPPKPLRHEAPKLIPEDGCLYM